MAEDKFPYASVEDYQKLYGAVDNTDMLQETLLDASRLIRAECKRAGVDVSQVPDEAMQVCRSIASRSMSRINSDTPFGATQYSESVINNSMSFTLANPFGVPRLMNDEKRLLGITKSRLKVIEAAIGDAYEDV